MAVRRERERRAVLEEAVAEMRQRGRPEFEAKDLFMDFKGIQVTVAKMSQALIDGRIDYKTAGRLVVELQTFSKLLWQVHRKGREGRKENQTSPQISADERRLKASTTKDRHPNYFYAESGGFYRHSRPAAWSARMGESSIGQVLDVGFRADTSREKRSLTTEFPSKRYFGARCEACALLYRHRVFPYIESIH
jgi:hypothetical protein